MPTDTTTRIKELRTALQTKASEIENLANSWTDETGKGQFVLSTKQHADYTKAVNDAQEIRDLIATEEKAAGLFAYLDGSDGGPSVAGDDAAAARRAGFQAKSLGQAWLESDEYKAMRACQFRRVGEGFTVDQSMHAFPEVKDVHSAMGGNQAFPILGRVQNLGWTERVLRPGRVRDLFPSESTNAAILYGVRETGFLNRAAVVPERTAADGSAATGAPTDVFGLKPRSDITITPYTANIATIAHIMYVHRQTLDDEPRLRGILDRDMVDGVKMAEDEQLLYGDGIGDNILGLFNQPGVQVYTGLTSGASPTVVHPKDRRSAQIRRAMTRAILAYYTPTGVVVHPLDWEALELEQDNNGVYTIATQIAVGGQQRMWRMNVVDTPAIQENRFVLGSFGTGAKVYDREQVRVDLSTENRDMFERNAYTLRAEERIGMVVDRPESFVLGTFHPTTP